MPSAVIVPRCIFGMNFYLLRKEDWSGHHVIHDACEVLKAALRLARIERKDTSPLRTDNLQRFS